jgi:excisionase family DNA binding protein
VTKSAEMLTCPTCGTVLYTTGEAAELLSVDRRTVNRWAEAGRFPNATRGRIAGRVSWTIPSTDIDALKKRGG